MESLVYQITSTGTVSDSRSFWHNINERRTFNTCCTEIFH